MNSKLQTRSLIWVLMVVFLLILSSHVADTAAAANTPGVEPKSVTNDLMFPGDSMDVDKSVVTPEIPPKPDIVFLVDTTTSMGPAIATVQANLGVILSTVLGAQPSANFAVAEYKDTADPEPPFAVLQGLTADTALVTNAINALTPLSGGGTDAPEDWINGLYQLGTGAVSYRPDGTPIIVLVGDSSSHDPSNGHTLGDAISALQAASVRVIAVDVGPTPGQISDGLDNYGQATAVANATGGVMMSDIDPGDVADAILEGLQNLPATVTPQLDPSCSNDLEYGFNPPSQTVTSGETAYFVETITVKTGALGGGYETCTVDWLINGVDAGPDFEQSISIYVNGPPVADPNGPYSGDEGQPLDFDGTGSYDPDGDPITYDWDFGDGSPVAYDAGPTPSHTYADNGLFTVCLTVTDPYDQSDTACTTADISNLPPVVTVDIAAHTVQYSDFIAVITFTATDVAADTLTATTTPDPLPDTLVLTDGGCSVNDGLQTCTWTLTGTMDQPVGDYTITLTVTDDDGGVGSADTVITVIHEDADIWIGGDNPMTVEVDTPGGDSPAFSIPAFVQETYPDDADYGPDPGDIDNAEVEMTLTPVGPGSSYTVMCTHVKVKGHDYDAVLEVSCDFDDVAVNVYYVEAMVVGDYYAGGPANSLLIVYDPSLGFTTGGGWFKWPETGNKTNFGYNVKYHKNGKKIQGNFLMINHADKGKNLRVKSTSMYGLAIGESQDPDFGWAAFVGKATFQYPTKAKPTGSYMFIVYVEDWDEPGSGDQFWIELLDEDMVVVDVISMERDAVDNSVDLGGGNIVVPH